MVEPNGSPIVSEDVNESEDDKNGWSQNNRSKETNKGSSSKESFVFVPGRGRTRGHEASKLFEGVIYSLV
jgi:hypothetical protein